MPKISISNAIPILAVVIAVGLLGFAAANSGMLGGQAEQGAEKLASAVRLAQAATGDNVAGYAWADTIGWISFSGTKYGVDVRSTAPFGEGNIEGYAWSDSVGWISFNSGTPDDLAGCPGSTCQANFNVDPATGEGTVTGWAKVMADGSWISLYSDSDSDGVVNGDSDAPSDYGVTVPQISCDWGGYAWSEQYGWVSFRGASYGVSGTSGSAACTSEEAVGEESVTITNLNTSTNGGTVTIVMRVEDETGASIPPTETATPHTTSVTADVDGGTSKNMLYDDSVPGEEKYAASFTGLSDGTHTANVSATDSRNLSDSDAAQFTIDTAAPPPPTLDPDPNDPPPPDREGGSDGDAEITNGIISATRSKFPEAETGDTMATITWDIDWGNNGGLDTSESEGDFCRVESVNGSASASLNSILAGEEDQQAGLVELAMDDLNGDGVPEETTYQLDCTDFENDRDDRYDLENDDGDKPSVTVGVDYIAVEIDSFRSSDYGLSLSSDPSEPNYSQNVTLNWELSDADECNAESNAADGSSPWAHVYDASWWTGGSEGVTLNGGMAGTNDFLMTCRRDPNDDSDYDDQGELFSKGLAITVTNPSFFISADPVGIDTTFVCESGGSEHPLAPVDLSLDPDAGYLASSIALSIDSTDPALPDPPGPIASSISLTEDNTGESGSSITLAKTGTQQVGGETTATYNDAVLDITIGCKGGGQYDGEHSIVLRGDPGTPSDTTDDALITVNLNVETFTPRFEEF